MYLLIFKANDVKTIWRWHNARTKRVLTRITQNSEPNNWEKNVEKLIFLIICILFCEKYLSYEIGCLKMSRQYRLIHMELIRLPSSHGKRNEKQNKMKRNRIKINKKEERKKIFTLLDNDDKLHLFIFALAFVRLLTTFFPFLFNQMPNAKCQTEKKELSHRIYFILEVENSVKSSVHFQPFFHRISKEDVGLNSESK